MNVATNNMMNRQYISSEVRFYTIDELTKMLGWSRCTVQKLFNDPKFPASDYGKTKVVETHALIDFFSRRQSRSDSRRWSKEGARNGNKR